MITVFALGLAGVGVYLLIFGAPGWMTTDGKDRRGRDRRDRLSSRLWGAAGIGLAMVLAYGYGAVHHWW